MVCSCTLLYCGNPHRRDNGSAEGSSDLPTKPSTGTYLRSTLLDKPVSVGKKAAEQVVELLSELGVPETPLASKAVIEAYDLLKEGVVQVVTLQAELAAKVQKTAALRARKVGLSGTRSFALGQWRGRSCID